VLGFKDEPASVLYISGDTVCYEGIAEIARRNTTKTVVLYMGAARIPKVGPAHLTMTTEDGIQAASAFGNASIVPLHFEGWAHLTESRKEIQRGFAAAGLDARIRWIGSEQPTVFD
jgi:hypothetical protein